MDCYETGTGSSGFTYRHGVIDAIKSTNPAVLYFENVTGVIQSRALKDKSKTTPPIEATWHLLQMFVNVSKMCLFAFVYSDMDQMLQIEYFCGWG